MSGGMFAISASMTLQELAHRVSIEMRRRLETEAEIEA